ncbi:MAG: lipid flippase MurJ, partial [Verrucomicrobiales bacterium]|nr:lipid flippase MurJ [Verrucomicrobiales bacterium]
IVYSMVNVIARSFYALNDYKTPMKISLFCLAVNLLLALVFLPLIRQAGLGLANTLSSVCNVCFLIYALRIKLKKLELRELRKESLPLIPAGVAAALVAWGLYRVFDKYLGHGNLGTKLLQVFGPIGVASILYYGLAVWARVPAAHEVLNLFKEKLLRKILKSPTPQ